MAALDPRVLAMVKEFINSNEPEAFLTGPAGAGKTTELYAVVEWLEEIKLNYMMVAYTHQAKEILASKMPQGTPIKTLHSWLKKRPGINEKAKHLKHITTNHQMGRPDHLQLLIVDEFSFVGEADYLSIGELQDELALELFQCTKCGKEYDHSPEACLSCNNTDFKDISMPPIQVLYVGDLNQLSPIKGESAVIPMEPYWVKLTKIHRTTTTISGPLQKLVKMIENEIPMAYLEPTENFKRAVDIDKLYKADTNEDKMMFAYTNKAVQAHNAKIQGYTEPKEGDQVFISTLRATKTFVRMADELPFGEVTVAGNKTINNDTKFNPLKLLNSLEYVKFFFFDDSTIVAGIFGAYENKIIREKLGKALVDANKRGKDSKKAYREYKTISDFTCVIDFNHCMTVHKSQGAEFTNVYVDSKDLATCKDTDERMKLLYVAMSRSKHSIFMNS